MRATASRTANVVVVVVVACCLGCPPDPPPPPPACPAGQGGEPCAFVWQEECAAADLQGCLPASPVRCDIDDPAVLPAYDCETCGCADADACVPGPDGSLCLSADVREGQRDADVIDDGLEDADYVELLRRLHDPTALTLDEVLERLRARRAADPRRSVVVVGSDEPEIDSVVPALFAGSLGSVQSADGCANVEAGLLDDDDDGQVLVTAADRAHERTCLHPGVFARCVYPSVAGCAQLQGLLPETLIVLGRQAIADVDNALLRRAARAGRDEWLARFDAQLGLFSEVFLGVAEARFDHPAVPGSLRFIVEQDDVVFGLLEDRPDASQLRTFRLMWVNASVQQFLIEHDITPSECVFVVTPAASNDDDAVVDVDCNKNGARASGRVLLQDNDLSGLALVAP